MKTFDSHLWYRFWIIAVPYWRHEEKWKAWALLVLVVLLLFGQAYFAVLINEQTGEFTSALAARQEERFWTSIRTTLGLLVVMVPLYAFYYFTRDMLGIHWRRWLTHRFLAAYFAQRHYYELNAVAGLWYRGSGRIASPPGQDIMFLPQQPYMILGSLRSQILYPNTGREVSETELLSLLDRVRLSDLAERFGGLDAERDWEKVLSIGEQQRLAFARVLLSRPRYVVLDEATSALDVANEEHLYQELVAAGVTPVSVSHHNAILKYHRQMLELTGNGGWCLKPLDTPPTS